MHLNAMKRENVLTKQSANFIGKVGRIGKCEKHLCAAHAYMYDYIHMHVYSLRRDLLWLIVAVRGGPIEGTNYVKSNACGRPNQSKGSTN